MPPWETQPLQPRSDLGRDTCSQEKLAVLSSRFSSGACDHQTLRWFHVSPVGALCSRQLQPLVHAPTHHMHQKEMASGPSCSSCAGTSSAVIVVHVFVSPQLSDVFTNGFASYHVLVFFSPVLQGENGLHYILLRRRSQAGIPEFLPVSSWYSFAQCMFVH